MRDIILGSINETLAFGEALGRAAQPGSAIALCGGLGAGKTHLAKGIVSGCGGDQDQVSSPTFALVQEYPGGRLPVFHFDFYRLVSADEVLAVGWDEYLEAGGVCVVEWADLFPMLLPEGTQWWRLELSGDGARRAVRVNPDGSPWGAGAGSAGLTAIPERPAEPPAPGG